ncbi:hypothetical protein ACFVYF_09495 [Streptomyces sp. NPDC058274]|uniref:hypothetical protein n=1 Tax=Streptomyces sp. NPDC058274 TaxID=3346416 RepID=UPI0036E1F6D6
MGKLRTLLVGAALAALTVGVTPLTAQASSGPALLPPGSLYVYYNTGYSGWCDDWSGEAPDWGSCRNQVSSLFNNGYPGNLDDIWVYWGLNYTGARRGVYQGVGLSDLRQWKFDANTGPGSGEWLNDNISSHRWTNLP